MIASPAATMHQAEHEGRRVLVGKVAGTIEAGSWLVLIRAGDDYRLVMASEDPGDPEATITLASFLSPEQIDQIEKQAALEAATKKRRKAPRKRKAKR